MRVIDATRPLSERGPTYPGDGKPCFTRQDRDGYTCSGLSLTTHSGTHLDAPSHYLPDGMTVDRIPLGRFMGKVRVLDLQGAGNGITAGILSGRVSGVRGILLRTGASGATDFGPDYPHLDPDAARFLAGAGVRIVGIDSPSVEAFGGDGSVHRELLGRGILILELLDLSEAPEGEYFMIALPLRLEGLDGSPARVILIAGGSMV